MLRFTNILPVFRYGLKASWANAEVHKPFDGKVQNVTLIPGIGIGPEITSSYLFKLRLCIRSFSSS
jgi:predicted Rdx family selenoprotein